MKHEFHGKGRLGAETGDYPWLLELYGGRRKRLVLLRPHGRLLAMTTLHLAEEVHRPDGVEREVVEAAYSEEDLSLLLRINGPVYIGRRGD